MTESAEKKASVTDLGAVREAHEPSENLRCRACGGEWFQTQVVIDKKTQRVTGYAADVACSECGDVPSWI